MGGINTKNALIFLNEVSSCKQDYVYKLQITFLFFTYLSERAKILHRTKVTWIVKLHTFCLYRYNFVIILPIFRV